MDLTEVFRVKVMTEVHRPLDGAVEAVRIRVGVTVGADMDTRQCVSLISNIKVIYVIIYIDIDSEWLNDSVNSVIGSNPELRVPF